MSGPFGMMEKARQILVEAGLHGLGHLHFQDPQHAPHLANGEKAASLILIGPIGGSLWPAFSAWRDRQSDGGGDNPLDTWSRSVMEGVASMVGATAYFPFDEPYHPFQNWAMQAEGLATSPLGLLIHPRFGLWHSYRAALGFSDQSAIGAWHLLNPSGERSRADICGSCVDKPCLTACPVGAVDLQHFDVTTCRMHLAILAPGQGCMGEGCLARNACPIGKAYRPPAEQLRFHMAALSLPPRGHVTPQSEG
ncbi:hypothetical protein [Rhizobium sp. AAP43]|uniref:hypothetical protein n=1 Tax=Rhizobium sp. AAP43 TaxID=1523420 RepID=UPI0006B9DDBE|nr:hypothetical protein [Rhizobium sp. AAP43]KPF43725.1 hypothetical protein IP76_12555 [Rhizobium sp. AAP43]